MNPSKQIQVPAQRQYIPMIKITPSYICGYHQYCGEKRKIWQNHLFTGIGDDRKEATGREQQQAYTGEITESARKKLSAACDILFALAKRKKVKIPSTGKNFTYRIALVTLTLSAPQEAISDREIKKVLLEPFLRHFRAKGMLNYVWKAERQKNGNIHFHILTDSWVDKNDCKDYWNRLQARLGFIEKFYHKNGHRHPNSTDVKSVKDDNGMKNYLLKYMLKEVDKGQQLEIGRSIERKDTGKVWDCSLNLKSKNTTTAPIEDNEFELLTEAEQFGNLRRLETDFCTLYFPVNDKIWNVAPEFLSKRIIRFLAEIRAKGKERPPTD